jgi:CheY-specific phosphatase CheX
MNKTAAEDIAKRFGLESVPESVKRLTEMVAKRDATLEDFAKIVAMDSELSERLLRAANPRATRKEDYRATTVEEALQRAGMSIALLLAMSSPIVRAVLKTFHTMLAIELEPRRTMEMSPFDSEHVLAEVSFVGKTSGLVHLRLPSASIAMLGDRLLGLPPEALADEAIANDVLGELCNMIVGNFKSYLCDAGLDCKLSIPKIARTADFKLHAVSGGTSERQGFQAAELCLYADLSVNPWTGGKK